MKEIFKKKSSFETHSNNAHQNMKKTKKTSPLIKV